MLDDEYDLSREGDDSFGPGSDLILSLLALSLLLLGVVGSGAGTISPIPEDLICQGPDCQAPVPTVPSVSLETLQEVLAERDELKDQRDEFRALSQDLMDYTNRLREAQSDRSELVPAPKPSPQTVTVGTYPLSLSELQSLSVFEEVNILPIRIAAQLERDFSERSSSLQHPAILEIVSAVPAELTALYPARSKGGYLIAELYKASTELASAFQSELLSSGVALSCIRIVPIGHSQSLDLRRAITSQADNLEELERLQVFYKTRPEQENLAAIARVQISLVPDQERGCRF